MRTVFLFLLALLLLPAPGKAQKFFYTQYQATQGLPSNHVHVTVRNSLGFVWAATDRGLARYDGQSFTTYWPRQGSQSVEALVPRPSGGFLFATDDGMFAVTPGVDFRAEVPDHPVWSRADEGGVQIVLRNLVSNAIKYTNEGGAVRVRARMEDEAAVLEVEDTGIGIEPEMVSELFEPFRQGSEGPSREYEGTGLGLALTRQVLEQMEGEIEVESEKGTGSRFTVRLKPERREEPEAAS